MSLPSFNEHDGHSKLSPLTEAKDPGPSVTRWLSRVSEARDHSTMRVLDLGCGKGATVAWLLEQRYDAYGIDVRDDYIENGRAYVGSDRLAVLEGSDYPYPDNFFDIVISNQVFEHVSDLDGLAREVSRTTKVGGLGLHIFPAKWVFTEPHMYTPVVHWLPKGRIRRIALKATLRAGLAAPFFAEYALEDRTEIFAQYSENETFYRRPRAIRRELEKFGLIVDFREASRDRMLDKLGVTELPAPVEGLAAWLYRHTRMMCLTTVKAR
jgi:SAM-dependent methyltransferase